MRLQGISRSGFRRISQWLESGGKGYPVSPDVWESAVFEGGVIQEADEIYLVPSVTYRELQADDGPYDTYVDIGGAHGDVSIEKVIPEEDGVRLENVRLWTFDEIGGDEDVYEKITSAIRSQYSSLGPQTFAGKRKPR